MKLNEPLRICFWYQGDMQRLVRSKQIQAFRGPLTIDIKKSVASGYVVEVFFDLFSVTLDLSKYHKQYMSSGAKVWVEFLIKTE